jgi:hypothetical protein
MSFLTILILALVFVLTGIFLVRSKIIGLMAQGLKLGFAFCIFVIILSLFVPSVYTKLADLTLRQSGTLAKIQTMDDSMSFNVVKETSENVWEDFEDFLNINKESEDAQDEKKTEGFLEDNFYPGLVSLTAGILRFAAIVLSLLGLVGIIYLSYAAATVDETRRLQVKVQNLEERLRVLENNQI